MQAMWCKLCGQRYVVRQLSNSYDDKACGVRYVAQATCCKLRSLSQVAQAMLRMLCGLCGMRWPMLREQCGASFNVKANPCNMCDELCSIMCVA
eukprot:7167918-Pyramimonas_sp.AAC.1